MTIKRIVSGGQTGVDRAALDVAFELGIPCGGWCPRGRRAEDEPISPIYPLTETPSRRYSQRTKWNIRDSDGTLVLTCGPPSGGTGLTVSLAERMHRPLLIVDLLENPAPSAVVDWLETDRIHILNVAGPRESLEMPVYAKAHDFLLRIFDQIVLN